MTHSELVSVVVPIHNHGACLESFLRTALSVLRSRFHHFELVLVDDGSTDDSVIAADRLLQECSAARLVRLSRPFGLDMAVLAGLETAIGDFVVVLHPDSDPPEEIERMVALARGGADVVEGLAVNAPRSGLVFRLCQAAFSFVGRRWLGWRVPPSGSSLYGFTRRTVNALTRVRQRHRHLGLLAASVGYPRQTFAYRKVFRAPPRRRGLREAIDLGLGLLVTHSTSPLRLVSYVGCVAALCNLLYVGYVAAVNLVRERVTEGWTTLSLQIASMFFLVFLLLTLLSEYVGHLLEESHNRPLYHVLEERVGGQPVGGDVPRNVISTGPVLGDASAGAEGSHAA